jgi:CxxC motif-containing protein (DUF1111 family)
MFLRLSVPPQSEADRKALASHRAAVIAEPTYGTQLQNFAIQGIPEEGRMAIAYEDVPVTFADGEVVTLRKPTYKVVGLKYGPLHPQAMLSPPGCAADDRHGAAGSDPREGHSGIGRSRGPGR